MQMLNVAMSSIIGDYDDADLVPEWQWVKQMASHEHVGVKDDSAYEYTPNLAMISIRSRQRCNRTAAAGRRTTSCLQRLTTATISSLIHKQHKGPALTGWPLHHGVTA